MFDLWGDISKKLLKIKNLLEFLFLDDVQQKKEPEGFKISKSAN